MHAFELSRVICNWPVWGYTACVGVACTRAENLNSNIAPPLKKVSTTTVGFWFSFKSSSHFGNRNIWNGIHQH